MKKQLLSLLLVLIMVFSILPTPALAADAETIAPGDQKNIVVEAGQSVTYTFTPSETAEYTFWNSGRDEAYTNIYNSDNQLIFNGNAPLALVFEAGSTYSFKVNNRNSFQGSFELHLEKNLPMESVVFQNPEVTLFVGETRSFPLSFEPFNSIRGDYTWTLSNPDVAVFTNRFNGGCDLRGEKAGTTTLTVQVGGKTASCQVTVKDPASMEKLNAGDVRTLNMNHGDFVEYSFTAAESGEYTFWNALPDDAWIEAYDSDFHRFFSGGPVMVFNADAGDTFIIRVSSEIGRSATYEIHLEKNVPMNSVYLFSDSVSLFEGQTCSVNLQYDPINSIRGDVVWSVADSDVVSFVQKYCLGSVIYGEKAGTTTLSVQVGGQTLTCQVEVIAPEVFTPGDVKSVELEAGEHMAYRFTPTQSGEYTFWNASGDSSYWFRIYRDNERINNGNAPCAFEAEAGVSYLIEVYSESPSGAAFELHLEKNVPMESVSMMWTEISIPKGSSCFIPLEYEPFNSIRGNVEWSIADTGIAAFQGYFSGGCNILGVSQGTTVVTAVVHGQTLQCRVTVTCPHSNLNIHQCPDCGATLPCVDHNTDGQCDICGKTMNNTFTDVQQSDYYYEPVLWAVENGITNGYGSDTTFAPDLECTRSQVVTFLWRSAGCPAPASSENPFKDVPDGQWYTDAILWAVEQGITQGYGSADTFQPNGVCTRAQVVTFLWRAANKPSPSSSENPFKDVPDGEWYTTAVLWAVEEGITNGYGGNDTFAPNITCTRGQIVTFLYRSV